MLPIWPHTISFIWRRLPKAPWYWIICGKIDNSFNIIPFRRYVMNTLHYSGKIHGYNFLNSTIRLHFNKSRIKRKISTVPGSINISRILKAPINGNNRNQSIPLVPTTSLPRKAQISRNNHKIGKYAIKMVMIFLDGAIHPLVPILLKNLIRSLLISNQLCWTTSGWKFGPNAFGPRSPFFYGSLSKTKRWLGIIYWSVALLGPPFSLSILNNLNKGNISSTPSHTISISGSKSHHLQKIRSWL